MFEEEWQPATILIAPGFHGCRNRVGIFAEVEVEEGVPRCITYIHICMETEYRR